MLIDRNGIYHYKFQIDGKLYRGSTKQTGIKKATTFEQVLIGKIKSGEEQLVKDKSPYLETYLATFSSYIAKNNKMAAKTKEYYQAGIEFLKKQPIAKIRLHMIRPTDIETIQFPKEYAGSTINRVLRTLRRVLNVAAENDVIAKCPKVKLVREHQRQKTISPDLADTIMGDISASGKLAMTIMLDCGLRPSEIVALKVEDHIDLHRNKIIIASGKTERAARLVTMSSRVRDAILDHLKGRTKGWLLPSNRRAGKPIQRQTLTQAFAEVRRAQGLPKGTVLYLARHTYATYIMEDSGNVFAAKEAMGHTSTSTLARYQHPMVAGLADGINTRNAARELEKVTKKSHLQNAPGVTQASS